MEATTTLLRLEALRVPFVYRKYFDFDALASLRSLRSRIREDWERRALSRSGLDKTHNIKLGDGGIREIEFVVQLNQLIRGGRLPSLQQRGLHAAIYKQKKAGVLGHDVANGLEAAYFFSAPPGAYAAIPGRRTNAYAAPPHPDARRVGRGHGFGPGRLRAAACYTPPFR